MRSGSAQRGGGVWLTSSATVSPPPEMEMAAPAPPPQLMTLGEALRRALLGLVILFTVAGLGAWLLYASIEPDGTTGPDARSDYALPPG